MRDIRFRVWDKVTKKMLFPVWITRRGIEFGENGWSSNIFALDYELTQFTGLLDRNSKEIFEGDIVKEIGYPNPAKCLWFDEGAGFVFQGIKNPDDVWCPNSEATSRGFEVIGNIYENPELLG